MGYREVSYESWLQRQVLELRENVINKNCNIPHIKNLFYELTNDERLEILDEYCIYCGNNEKNGKCYCASCYDE